MTIYRKYRPQTFGEVFGQQHIVETLTKAIKLSRVAHAYLFTGSRGVGKTTLARLLAKAVNCTSSGKEIPCGKCSSCQAIAENRFIDLIEIDAASNRGIDEIRELREKIQFAPSLGKKRVYIIDEIHMLTREAFNALLKTLEEPPGHTIFIFATTEAHKIPVTVLSRCQRFDFTLASDELIKKSIQKIVKEEGFKLDEKIIDVIVRCADGSFRDAQSLLDQLSSHLAEEGELSFDQALMLLNLSSLAQIEEFVLLLKSNEIKKQIAFVQQLKEKGISLADFVSQLVAYLRRELIEKIKVDQDSRWEKRVLEELIKAESQMKNSTIESLPLELAVYELAFGEHSFEEKVEKDPEQIELEEAAEETKGSSDEQSKADVEEAKEENQTDNTKIDQLKIKNGTRTVMPNATKNSQNSQKAGESKERHITQDIKQAVVAEVMAKNKSLGILLNDLGWGGDAQEVQIIAEYAFHQKKIMDKQNLLLLENCLENVLQCKSKVSCQIKKQEDLGQEIESVFGE